MSKRGQALADHVASYVSERIDAPITLEALAQHVGVSKYHLSRLFEAATGFALGEYVQRRRLQRAFYLLAQGQASVLDVALMVGYESHSAFSRAFHKAFQRQPSEVQRGERCDYQVPLRAKAGDKRAVDLAVEMLELPEQRIPGLYGKGFSDNSFSRVADELFQHLHQRMHAAGLGNPAVARVGVSLDSPWQAEQAECRFFAGIDLPEPLPGFSDSYTQAAGAWAMCVHRGPYRLMWQTISQIYASWVLPNGIALQDQAIVQRYCNDPRSCAPDELITELYFAI